MWPQGVILLLSGAYRDVVLEAFGRGWPSHPTSGARSAGPPSPLRGPAEPASRARWPAPRAREARAAGLRGPLRGPAGPRI